MSLPEFVIPAGHPAEPGAQEKPRPSPIDAVCDAAIARLKDRLPVKVVIEDFPDKPEEFDFEGYDAAALVLFDGSTFDEAGPVGQQGTRETQRLVVGLLVRTLRGPTGAYGLIHEIRTALHGQSLAGMTGLRPLKVELERQAEGVFQYTLAFEGKLPAVPVRSAGVSLPNSFPERR